MEWKNIKQKIQDGGHFLNIDFDILVDLIRPSKQPIAAFYSISMKLSTNVL